MNDPVVTRDQRHVAGNRPEPCTLWTESNARARSRVFGREAWLFWNLGLNKLGEKFERLLPPKVAGLEGNGVG